MKSFKKTVLIIMIPALFLGSCEKIKSLRNKNKKPEPVQLSAWISSLDSPESDILFNYNQEVLTESEEGQTLFPELTFDPPISGSLHWDDEDTLRFSPDPGQFSWGARIEVTLGSFIPLAGEEFASDAKTFTINLPRYSAGNKVASWDTVVGRPRFISTLGSFAESDQIGSGPFYLLYDQPVDPDDFRYHLSLSYPGGPPVPYQLTNPSNLYDVFGMDFDSSYVLGITISDEFQDGEKLLLRIPSWSGEEGEEPEYTNITLEVNKQFLISEEYISGRRDSGAYEPYITMEFSFNNSFDMSQFREQFSIDPQPRDIIYRGFWGNTVTMDLDLEIGETYHVWLDKPMKDYLGNELSGKRDWTIRVRDHFPVLQLPEHPLLMEADRSRVPVRLRNIQSAELRLYSFDDVSDYIKALERSHSDSISSYGFRTGSKDISLNVDFDDYRLNEDFTAVLDLSRLDDPGYRLLEVVGDATGSEGAPNVTKTLLYHNSEAGIIAKVHDSGILVWVAGFGDAEPEIGYDVKLYDRSGRLLTSGVTDRYGLVTLDTDRANVVGVDTTLYLEARKAGQVSLMKLDNSELSGAWQFNMPAYPEDSLPIYGTVFTERGVYRPEEKVFIKTFIHPGDRAVPGDLTVKVLDPRGKVLLNQPVRLDDFYAADFNLTLPENAPVGRYDILIHGGDSNIFGNFQVEEYRVPTFVVNVEPQQDRWSNGEPVSMDVNAEYYNGGSMGSREVRWTVRRTQAPVHFSDFPDYIFQAADMLDSSGVYTSGDGTLNGEGDYQISFTPEQNSAAGRLRYTFEAVVTDIDRQAYAGRVSRYVDPAGLYVGVKPPAREVLQSGTTTEIPVVVVNPDGTVQSGKQVDVEVEYIQNHSSARMYDEFNAQMLNHLSGSTVSRANVRSGDAPVSWRFTPEKAGIYRINFTTKDSSGRSVKTFFYSTVTGDESTAWPRFDVEQIEVVKDKPIYRVGDVAKIVPQCPYREATALVTIERSGILETQLFSIDNDTPAIEIPITAEMSPNVYVSVVILRGRIHDQTDASGFETGAPGFKIGYTMISVDPADQRLLVNLDAVPENTAPGEQVTIPLQITDSDGRGVAGQLTVMVVDEAVLDMTGYRTPDPTADIYSPRPLGVRTGTNWLDLPHSRRERLEKLFPPGGDDEWGDAAAMNELLRNLFRSTAYWNPTLLTDASGRAEFSFPLPDNLTTYRVMVVAADRQFRYGSADREMVSQMPLMIQPVLPRFAYPEDEFSVEALILNGTEERGSVDVRVELVGLRLKSGSAEKNIRLNAGESGTVSFPVTAGISGDATIRFYAEMDGESDAAEFTLPILSPGTRRTVVESTKLSGDSSLTLNVPPDHIDGTLTAEAVLSKTALTELQDAVQYLMQYPYGCIEQTTSTAYPLVVLDDLLPLMGVEVDRGQLKEYADAGIKRILSFQTSQGGLSYWPGGSEPHAFATAFGLTALLAARDKGYDIPQNALDGMADYLEMQLRSGQITGEMPHGSIPDGDTRALFVMTLGRLGRPQPQYINALWDKRDQLTAFGLSFLAIAVEEMEGGDQTLLQPILSEIKRRAEIEESEAYFNGSRDGGWSMGSPLRTHGGALLAYGVTGSDPTTGGKFLTGLLERRQYGLWGNTQENVFGMMGVYEFAASGGGGGDAGNEDWDLILQDRKINPDSLEAPDRYVRRVSFTESELEGMPASLNNVTLESSSVGGYLSLRLSYEMPLSKANFDPESDGFVLQRTYETLDGKSLEGKNIPLGSLVKVRLVVSTDESRHYVAIDDKLPAGLEPLNSTLETTETAEMGELSAEARKGMSVLSYQEIRDSRVVFYVDEMIPGQYEFVYVARATTPGKFLRPAGRVEAMYEPEVSGTSGMNFVEIK